VPSELSEVVVIVPARNEEAALPLVLGDLPPVGRVIVVDNGSTDGTAEQARRHGAQVVREEQPGYGIACQAGLQEIERLVGIGEISRPQIVAFLDADYSDYPQMLPELAAPILSGDADFVLGSRLLGQREAGAMPMQSLFGNRLACFLMQLLWGFKYTDLGPFRLIRYDLLRQLEMQDLNYGWTIEMQIKAVVAGLRIMEMPVPYRRRIGISKISGTVSGSIQAGAKILLTIARFGRKSKRQSLARLRHQTNCESAPHSLT
jgi:glycosyltransferase involved in cell wall biosynthesis